MIIIYGKPGCGYCIRAKQLCERKGVDYKYIDIITESITAEELEAKANKPVKTVPQIFSDEQYIGGYTQLEEYLK